MNYKEFKQKIKEEIKAYKENIDFKLKKYKENQNKKLEKFKLKFNNKSKIKIKGGHILYDDLLNTYGLYIISLLLKHYYAEYYFYCKKHISDRFEDPLYQFKLLYYDEFDTNYNGYYHRYNGASSALKTFHSSSDNERNSFEFKIYDKLNRILYNRHYMLSIIFSETCVNRYLSYLYEDFPSYLMPDDVNNNLNRSLIDLYSNYCIAIFNTELLNYMKKLKDLYYPEVVSPDNDRINDVIDIEFENFFYSFKTLFESYRYLKEDLDYYFGDIPSYKQNIRRILLKIKNISDILQTDDDFPLIHFISLFEQTIKENIINGLLKLRLITMKNGDPKETYDALLAKIRNKISSQKPVTTITNDTNCNSKLNEHIYSIHDDQDLINYWDNNIKSQNRIIFISLATSTGGVLYNCYDIYGLLRILDRIAKQSSPEFVIEDPTAKLNISFDELLNIFKVAKESHYGYLLKKEYLLLLVLLELDEVSLKILYDKFATDKEFVSNHIIEMYKLHNFRYDGARNNWVQIN